MIFSSLTFLFIFLPILLAAYYACPVKHRNTMALAGSLAFYAWGAPRFVFVLIFSSVVNYGLGRFLPEGRTAPRIRKGVLGIAILLNIALLGYFKYANFFVAEWNALLATLGFQGISWTQVALPLGISFFVFQKVSYLLDVYQGRVLPSRSISDYLLYVFLFPQLIAGPIVRYHDVASQLVEREHTAGRFFTGILRFCQGLGKKVLLANTLGEMADAAFHPSPAGVSFGWAWLGVLAYAFQIYFDFSGYSDMAIGLGRMLGFEFLENFNRPYISRSFTEFWRRWHISLANFMREYLYVPLGGNRKGSIRTYVNMWIVFLVSGFWHGASWNFVAWGAFHGLFLSLDKLLRGTRASRAPSWIAIPVTFLLVLFSWVLFRADTLSHAAAHMGRMLGLHASEPGTVVAMKLTARHLTVLLVSLILCFGPAIKAPPFDFMRFQPTSGTVLQAAGRFAVALILLVWSAAVLATSSFNPFIYFRF